MSLLSNKANERSTDTVADSPTRPPEDEDFPVTEKAAAFENVTGLPPTHPSEAGDSHRTPILTRDKDHSIFTRPEKWFLVLMAAIAGMFSPLSANIYFPAIPVLATAFNESVENINLTVTANMILQGISPMLWGSLADSRVCGRRPIYLCCLGLLCLSCVGLALTPTNAYWLLLFLRCFQAAGSASVVALGAGTIIDIATSAERGGFFGVFGLGPMLGPAIGPVIGGLLAGNLGWRSIFWFMSIAAGVVFVVELLFFPETLRTIVGDGSVPAPLWNRPIIPIIGRRRKNNPEDSQAVPDKETGKHNPLTVLALFGNPDVVLILVPTAISYAVFYGVITTLSPLFLEIYPYLTEVDIGLCYLANGAGCIVGSFSVGKMLDWEWQRIKRKAQGKGDLEEGTKEGVHMEHARLRTSPIYWLAMFVLVLVYGWLANAKVNMAPLLIFQFLIGWVVSAIFGMNQTLLMDLFPGHGASITACNNLTRCLTGAILVSIEDYIQAATGIGGMFSIFAGLVLLSFAGILVEWRMGRRFRRNRELRHAKKLAEKEKHVIQAEQK